MIEGKARSFERAEAPTSVLEERRHVMFEIIRWLKGPFVHTTATHHPRYSEHI